MGLGMKDGVWKESGAVGNADRIWASTPQNRTYREWKLSAIASYGVRKHIEPIG